MPSGLNRSSGCRPVFRSTWGRSDAPLRHRQRAGASGLRCLRTAFHPTTPGFRGLIDRFLAEREQLLKGPYVSVALPFHQGSGRNWFPQIPLPFPPYRHQERAFQRLLPGTPLNALVASGTGSGKTECFLLPLLEHCREQRAQGQRGIKAIVIYPMNALATDQARRIADLIHTIPAPAGLRAGLYIGASDDAPTAAMTATSVITDIASRRCGRR